jgi:hypothetical protein
MIELEQIREAPNSMLGVSFYPKSVHLLHVDERDIIHETYDR